MGVKEIEWQYLLIGYGMLIVPLFFLFRYRSGLLSDSLIAVVRMTLQLVLVGTYLGYLFEYDQAWINLGWVLVMTIVAAITTVHRSDLSQRWFAIPVLIGILVATVVTEFVILQLVLNLDNLYEARYLIPISGMILGNNLSSSIIGLRSYTHGIQEHLARYQYYLASGARASEARSPFIKEALQATFQPTIGTIATLGVVKLPGMMTGQILGGSAPMQAIQYQILIMIAIFSSTMIALMLTIHMSNLFLFDKMHNPRLERLE